MKRSEMIEKLEETFCGLLDKQDATAILNFLEKNGMKPPQHGNDYHSSGSGDEYSCFSTPSYEWEDEGKYG